MLSLFLASTVLATFFFFLRSPVQTQADPPPEAGVIDTFDLAQAWMSLAESKSSSSTVTGAGILGGERDLKVERTGDAGPTLEAGVGAGAFYYGLGPNLNGAVQLVWDGPDGDARSLAPTGLEGVDLTAGGTHNAFLLTVSIDDLPARPAIEIFSDGNRSSVFELELPGAIYTPTDYVLPFYLFDPNLGKGADFNQVGAVALTIPGTAGLDLAIDAFETTALLSATSTDSLLVDKDQDGAAGPGDTLQYTVLLSNPDDAFDVTAAGVLFNNPLDLNTTLVENSITTTHGVILSGNSTEDREVSIDIGPVADGDTVKIVFEVGINDPLPAGLNELTSQGVFSSTSLAELRTDDPDTDAVNDSTVTPVIASPLVTATKSDRWLDQDDDSQLSPGDLLTYTVTIVNEGNAAAEAVVFSDTLDPNTILKTGSLSATQGSITSGNEAGDPGIAIDLGTLAGAGGQATISFAVSITNSVSLSITEISNQGYVAGSNVPELATDDPDTDPPGDPTVTDVETSP